MLVRPSATRVGVLEKPVGTGELAVGPAGGAARFWDRMTLSAMPSAEPSATPMAVPEELRGVLRLFAAAADGSRTGGPSAPSAGALYPYEHYAVVAGQDGPAVYAVDAARRACRLVRAGSRVRHALETGGLPLCEQGQALVLTVVRPWLSMRKYGDRGYLYAQLDAAHVATQLLCVASDSHGPAELRAHIDARPLSELLGLAGGHRFVHSVLVLTNRPSPAVDTADGGWSCTDDLGGGLNRASSTWLETECWNWLTTNRPTGGTDPRSAVSVRPLLRPTAPGPVGLPAPGTLTALAARRRSTKDFAPQELSGRDLDRALAALRTPLATDLTADSELGATLVARRVSGRAPGNHTLFAPTPEATTGTALDGDTLVRACMGQEHLRHASALVVFHAPRHEVLQRGGNGLDETLLRAGALAHLLYLGAAGEDIAVTTIGGFDATRWRTLAGLPERHEVLYIALLGLPGRTAVKLDRLQQAYAHNER
ncbi:nitroreductase family protein [Streptomyces sp. NPDC002537]